MLRETKHAPVHYHIIVSNVMFGAGLIVFLLLRHLTDIRQELSTIALLFVVAGALVRRMRQFPTPWSPALIGRYILISTVLFPTFLMACLLGPLWLQLMMTVVVVAVATVFELAAVRRVYQNRQTVVA